MLPAIDKTSELVREISADSGKQADGIAQITSAMDHLNSATQYNASASERLSATAAELTGHALGMQQLIAFFRLEAESGRRTAASAHKSALATPESHVGAPAARIAAMQ